MLDEPIVLVGSRVALGQSGPRPSSHKPLRSHVRASAGLPIRRLLLAFFATTAVAVSLPMLAAGSAGAYTDAWYCIDGNNQWCGDPYGSHNWQEGEVQNLAGYPAYLCDGIWSGGHNYWANICSSSQLPYGDSFIWGFGTYYSWAWPLQGYGLQDNSYGVQQETYNWWWGP